MKTYLVDSDGGFEAITSVDKPEPVPGPGEVKIRIRAASLNYRDLGVSQGGYLRNDTCPVVPLSDAAGEIIAVGDGVTSWNVGDRVSPCFVRDWINGNATDAVLRTCLGGGVDGVLSEFVVLPSESLIRIPETMTFEQAATVPCAAVTAWHALFNSGNLQPDQTVLLLGTGGVSIFALQFARAAGAKVIITSSSDKKLEIAKSMGAGDTINYAQHPQWHQEVRRLTEGRGVDHVVEVGGPGTLERSLKSCTVGGHVHLIGVLDSPSAKVSPMLAVFNLLTVRGIYVGSREMHEQTLSMMVEHKIEPVIDRVFSFDDAIEAYRYFSTQQHVGKVVIRFD